jgi:hypothetical protein
MNTAKLDTGRVASVAPTCQLDVTKQHEGLTSDSTLDHLLSPGAGERYLGVESLNFGCHKIGLWPNP